MREARQFAMAIAAAAAFAGAASAQMAISARSGMIHYAEGRVLLEGQEVVVKATEFPEVREGRTLSTEEGRAEVLLTPGVFLRMAENTSIKMISSALWNTRVDVLRGSVVVECADLDKEHGVTLLAGDAEFALRKRGVYRFDTGQNLFRVYDGEAVVSRPEQPSLTLRDGRQTLVSGILAAEKFNTKVGDSFLRWAGRRSEAIAAANIPVARSSQSVSCLSRNIGGWNYSPYFGYFTYMPCNGFYQSWFGPRYYSIGNFWVPTTPQPGFGGGMNQGPALPTYNPSYGYSTVPDRSSSVYQGSAAPSAPAASAPVDSSPRGGDAGAPRDSGGGRGR